MKTLFFARDVRGGLGERRFFRVIMKYLAQNYPETVIKNIDNIAEFGRYDDILSLMDTACEQEAIAYIKAVLTDDMECMQAQDSVSLMAKWLPSVNTSSRETVKTARKIARAMGMSEIEYRKTLSSLRGYIKAQETPSLLNASTLTPYDIVWSVIKNIRGGMSEEERKSLDVTWNALENYVNSDNTLVVVDGSGSMYGGWGVLPAAVAESLGIYFAERNKGAFRNNFITFSANPKLVKIKGKDIFEKVKYCMSFNECSNTNIEKTFNLILNTAVKNRLKQSDMPSRIIIISDMEFDWCADNSGMTNFESAKAKYAQKGYALPKLVFWNVNSFNRQQPVTMNEQGVVLVSGMSPQIFAMLKDDNMNPYAFMMNVLNTERYKRIAA
jgi:hypothetical protein